MREAPSAMLIASNFPPVNAVGVHRSVALCRELIAAGWNVSVVTARPRTDVACDAALLDRVPEVARVTRAPAPELLTAAVHMVKFRRKDSRPRARPATPQTQEQPTPTERTGFGRLMDWLSWWLHVPDSYIGWLVPAVLAGLREARHRRPDVLFSSAPAWTGHLVAACLTRCLRVPWVADFRDPWCGSAWRRIPYGVHRRLDAQLEAWVVKHADRITCAWDGIRKHIVSRHPACADRIETILNGFDPVLIDSVPPRSLDGKRCVLLHAGTFYGPRSPLPLMEALRQAANDAPDAMQHLLVAFLGNPAYNGIPLARIAEQYGLEQFVRVMAPVPHSQALGILKGADVALLFGQSGFRHLASVPAKAYECIGAKRPVLAIGAGDEVCSILRAGGCTVWQTEATDVSAIAETLRQVAVAHKEGRLQAAVAKPLLPLTWSRTARECAVQRFTWERSAGRIREAMCAAIAEKG